MLNRFEAQRVIQALRTGVPTRAVVQTLGSGQSMLEKHLLASLSDVRSGADARVSGFVFNGGFGQGKSHLLEVFSTLALNANFVVSYATVSRNLPLHMSLSILNELAASARVRDQVDGGLVEVISDAVENGVRFNELVRWTDAEVASGRLASLFGGIASALCELRPSGDHFEVIIQYLNGNGVYPVIGDVRKAIAAVGVDSGQLKKPTAATRAEQTARFLSRLFCEIGYAGWVILIDELELIRLQGPVSRGKAYAELAFWMGLDPQRPLSNVVTVGAVTDDFVHVYLNQDIESDRTLIPNRLRSTDSNFDLAIPAEIGMDFLIQQDANTTQRLTLRRASEVQTAIRQQYALALACSPSEITITAPEVRKLPIRTMIRKWITYWDLERADRRDEVQEFLVDQVVDNHEAEDREDG